MDLRVEVQGLDKIPKNNKRLMESIQEELSKALLASALKVESDAKTSIARGPKTGRIYVRGNITHRASAPGQAPATDTGRLINSIVSYVDKSKLAGFIIAGRGAVKYARMLEFGTVKMAARPFMLPALKKNKQWIFDRVKQAMEQGIKNGSDK